MSKEEYADSMREKVKIYELKKKYKKHINEINKELERIARDRNPKENYVIDRIASRKTTLLEVIADLEGLLKK